MNGLFNINVTVDVRISERARRNLDTNRIKITNPKFHRTSEERKAKVDFFSNNSKIIKEYEDQISDSRCYDRTYTLEKRILLFENCINSYYKFRDFCYRPQGGEIYFQDTWEYCHNSKSNCFAFVDSLIDKKKKLENQIAKERDIADLERDLYETLTIEHPILQSKLFSYYPPQYKSYIKKILDEWESYEAISKTKYGKSYMIDLVD